ncbi:uncharacterized protein LOC128035915 isoform X3 [Gossypium raimondii]|uniref:uncharacterized protein LOC128035915 isoform X3 n=1 Tax=Gossypium raimondii TaxID=29730 RepID=UPI00227B3FA4|nr:uncharacterized protein LOC128035915 isoform X3 [Gossypium raimondii]
MFCFRITAKESPSISTLGKPNYKPILPPRHTPSLPLQKEKNVFVAVASKQEEPNRLLTFMQKPIAHSPNPPLCTAEHTTRIQSYGQKLANF